MQRPTIIIVSVADLLTVWHLTYHTVPISSKAAATDATASFLDDLDPLVTKKSNHQSPANAAAPTAKSRTPQSFLGENSGLVNLDNLIKPANPVGQSAFGAGGALSAAYSNPFGESTTGAQPKTNLFQQQTQPVSLVVP